MHFAFVHEVVLLKLSLINNVRQPLFIVNSHNFFCEILKDALRKADFNLAILVEVMLVEQGLDMSLNRLIVVCSRLTIRQCFDIMRLLLA